MVLIQKIFESLTVFIIFTTTYFFRDTILLDKTLETKLAKLLAMVTETVQFLY